MEIRKIIFLLALLLISYVAAAQAEQGRKEISTDSTSKKSLPSEESIWKYIKLSGYIQAQFQYGQPYSSLNVGAPNDNFDKDFNRMGIRRGRIKLTAEEKYVLGVFQLDITELGVGVKDAYVMGKDAWFKSNSSLKLGIFDRPFGYEISYSSSQRESPERATVFQTLFPNERDLGGMLTLQMPKTSPLSILKLEAGLFSGNGIKKDMDNRKDFIGHLNAGNTIGSFGKWGFGFSYYNGGVYNPTIYNYDMQGAQFVVDSSGKAGSFAKREYFGFDGQLSFNWLPGTTTIRAEYLWGMQPGGQASSKSPNYDLITNSLLKAGAYNRPFNGYYIYLIQDIAKTPFTAVLKYDYYDPNSKISSSEAGAAGSNTSFADLACSTFGFGALWRITNNFHLQAYYEINSNETSTNTAVATEDNTRDTKDYSVMRKANVFTLRIQYKF